MSILTNSQSSESTLITSDFKSAAIKWGKTITQKQAILTFIKSFQRLKKSINKALLSFGQLQKKLHLLRAYTLDVNATLRNILAKQIKQWECFNW